MKSIKQVTVCERPLKKLQLLLGKENQSLLEANLETIHNILGQGRLIHINSTANGGGVAEMLPHLIGYPKVAGIDSRWLVVNGNAEFFKVSKRLHHALHGSDGDASPLGQQQRAIYEAVQAENAAQILKLVTRDDIVILHDPQTAGLIPYLSEQARAVIWRCHIGYERKNFTSDLGWTFLSPYLQKADAYVFSRRAYLPSCLDSSKSAIIAPSLDPLSIKNHPLDQKTVCDILFQSEILGDRPSLTTTGIKISRPAKIIRYSKAPLNSQPLITQISRWDPLKDHLGVLQAYRVLIESGHAADSHLALVGPDVSAVADDPEGSMVLEEVIAYWQNLPPKIRRRVSLISLSMIDLEENSLIVNALQQHSAIVLQKSLQEGFGLTVAEAMWKTKAVIASRTGGIQDQIQHERSGILLDDSKDQSELAHTMQFLLEDPLLRKFLGKNARKQVKKNFLINRHLQQYAELFELVLNQSTYQKTLSLS